ncbi:MAG TPA: SOS response-associated peptidase family protein, partial [Rhizomicrobium sp.]|nr:SOS response-associated peptidase family protein [Rhizomicrobium sp.]
SVSPEEALNSSGIVVVPGDAGEEIVLNTPMRLTPIVCLDDAGNRTVIPMRWGWVDPNTADPLKKPGMMHARGETADAKPLWKQAFASTRGVTFVQTFNVGEEVPGGRVKQWTCRRADGKPLAIAVIWEKWVHPRFGSLHVYVPVTTFSPEIVNSKDDRFPVLLDTDEDIALWLGETGAPLEEIKTLVRVYDGELIVEEEKKDEPKKSAKSASPKTEDQPSLF